MAQGCCACHLIHACDERLSSPLSSILFYFLVFSFISYLLHFHLHFFHFLEGRSEPVHFAEKGMDSLEEEKSCRPHLSKPHVPVLTCSPDLYFDLPGCHCLLRRRWPEVAPVLGPDEDIPSTRDGFTSWVILDTSATLERHVASKGCADTVFRNAYETRNLSPQSRYRSDNGVCLSRLVSAF